MNTKKFLISFIIIILSSGQAFAGNYDYAMKYYKKGDYTRADKYFQKALKTDPSNLKIKYNYALNCIKNGKKNEGLNYLKYITNTAPNSYEAFMAKQILDKEIKKQQVVIKTNSSNSVVYLHDIKINGKPSCTYVFDTGASITTIPKSIAKKLKLKTTGASKITLSTANGKVKAPLIKIDRIELRGLVAHNVPVVVHDLDKNNQVGLLGMSFLKNFKIQMDKAEGKIIIEKK